MFRLIKQTEIRIDDIIKIVVEKAQDMGELGYSERVITIWTTAGEVYKILLEAVYAENLEFKDPEPDEVWLKPKLYNGSKNLEE
jgi:hypothetical protein